MEVEQQDILLVGPLLLLTVCRDRDPLGMDVLITQHTDPTLFHPTISQDPLMTVNPTITDPLPITVPMCNTHHLEGATREKMSM